MVRVRQSVLVHIFFPGMGNYWPYGRRLYTAHSSRTVNPEEIGKFNSLSQRWWDPNGPLRLLRKMNRVRIPFMLEGLGRSASMDLPTSDAEPLRDLDILDVGCGAGFLTEPLARLGSRTIGIDAAAKNIELAKLHRQEDPSLNDLSLKYYNLTTSDLLNDKKDNFFNAISAMEIIEHVDEPQAFISEIHGLLKVSCYKRIYFIFRIIFA